MLQKLLNLALNLLSQNSTQTNTPTVGIESTSNESPKQMEILLQRRESNSVCTLGDLYCDGVFECYTLEDPPQATKIYGNTRIPAGKYKVTITWSPRFKTMLPLLENVPEFEGIRIHPGNYAKDTECCILPGLEKGPNCVLKSKDAFRSLFDKIQNSNECWITIKD